jgi:hypothetical protein
VNAPFGAGLTCEGIAVGAHLDACEVERRVGTRRFPTANLCFRHGEVDLGAVRGASGGALPDAVELERRTVLSQYLTRANSAGMTPPQETGLLSNSWSGRFHLEMRWWHQAHFPLWGRPDWLDRSHAFYFELLENATSLAAQQGFRGARSPAALPPSATLAAARASPPPPLARR